MDRGRGRQIPSCYLGKEPWVTLPLSLLCPDNGYRECLANGSWAARVNYSECQEILSEEVRLPCGYQGPQPRSCLLLGWGPVRVGEPEADGKALGTQAHISRREAVPRGQ